MKIAAKIGISISDFWEMTPTELYIYADAYSEKALEEYETKSRQDAILAFLTSRWVWQKKVDINKYISALSTEEETEEQEAIASILYLYEDDN